MKILALLALCSLAAFAAAITSLGWAEGSFGFTIITFDTPPTNASGRMAAMTVKVARIVGLPTSSTALTMRALKAPLSPVERRAWRTTPA